MKREAFTNTGKLFNEMNKKILNLFVLLALTIVFYLLTEIRGVPRKVPTQMKMCYHVWLAGVVLSTIGLEMFLTWSDGVKPI